MRLHAALLAACLFAAAPGFADPVPVPPAKANYVGEWLGEKMRLKIGQDGHVEYKRERPGKNVDLTVDLQGFNGDDFDVGAGIIRSTFVVSKPPHRDKGKWKMTVDGVELTRVE
ncbi:hypothetical protein [uncultured Massilia sp.]|uniref:hypothetical protein n=1 Tax=uncultured Massilia sp. TaxID=169973 RepID=UPI0025DF7357|nr:hypothetical protein [uncultured Massilia sp.]